MKVDWTALEEQCRKDVAEINGLDDNAWFMIVEAVKDAIKRNPAEEISIKEISETIGVECKQVKAVIYFSIYIGYLCGCTVDDDGTMHIYGREALSENLVNA